MSIRECLNKFIGNSFFATKVLFFSLFVGLFFGSFFLRGDRDNFDCLTNLHFIKPTLDCRLSDEKSEQFSLLEEKLAVLIDIYKRTGKATRVSVFVRDLKTTKFAAVNDGESFVMASLLKVPLVIAGYKLAEVEPKVLDQDFIYKGVPNLYKEQNFKVSQELELNKPYKLREIMRRSIVYSDNTAAQIISEYYAPGFFDKVLLALGLNYINPDDNGEDIVTARSYANIFRILYNSSYLTREYSDQILAMLTETEYKSGALASLPKNVVVAHKFGERAFNITKNGVEEPYLLQFHECGLVYANDKKEPYTFCFMTEGADFKELEKIQSEISLTVYSTMVTD